MTSLTDAASIFSRLMKLFVAVLVFCPIYGRAVLGATTLSATQVTALSFGTLQAPPSGSQTFTVDSNGATSGTGTLLYGSPVPGQYTLTCSGTCNQTITIDIQNVNSGNANVTISNFEGSYNNRTDNITSFPKSNRANPKAGKTLFLGATATYNSSVPTTPITPSFDIVLSMP